MFYFIAIALQENPSISVLNFKSAQDGHKIGKFPHMRLPSTESSFMRMRSVVKKRSKMHSSQEIAMYIFYEPDIAWRVLKKIRNMNRQVKKKRVDEAVKKK